MATNPPSVTRNVGTATIQIIAAGNLGPPGKPGPQGPAGPVGSVEVVQAATEPTGVEPGTMWIDTGVVPPTARVRTDTGWQDLRGPQGEKGDTGPAPTILGPFANQGALPTPGDPNRLYLVEPGELFIWVAPSGPWQSIGSIRGPKGDQGDKGDKGDKGDQGLPAPAFEEANAPGPSGAGFDTVGAVWIVTDEDAPIGVGPRGPTGPPPEWVKLTHAEYDQLDQNNQLDDRVLYLIRG